ncbi:MAG: flippase-like domain-containing protein [Ruminococcus sp.]|nr:flippase-like domain-containing protein [Ruminococcus sp.]
MSKLTQELKEEIAEERNAIASAKEDEGEEPKKHQKLKKWIGIALFVALNAVVLYFTAKDDFSKPPKLTQTFGFTNILFILGGILCLVIVLMAETFKYMLMMKHLNEKVSFRVAFETAALGKYYDCITPSGAGGQPFQIYHLHSNGYSDGAASAMPLSGFFTMQFGFVFLAILVFIFHNNAIGDQIGIKITAYIGAVAYTIVPVMIIISAVAPKIAMKIVAFFVKLGAKLHIFKKPNHTIMKAVKALNNYSVSLKAITNSKGLLTQLLILSVIFQAAIACMPFFAVRTFGGDIGFIDAACMCIYIYAAITIVPTPGNSGAAEGSFYIIFSSLGTSGVFWAMLVWRFLCYYSFIVIGLLVYAVKALKKILSKKKDIQNESV